jgi:type II secretory pathway component GspD/PulD (secretin)
MHCRLISLILTVTLVLVSSSFAQLIPAEGTETELDRSALSKTVTIDADDASLPTVLSILAAESGYNIVTGPGVNKQERISIHLKNTPIEEAMNLVVRAAGLSYEIVGKSFLVAEARKLEEEVGLTSYVVELQYSKADEVAEMLKDFNANIQIDKTGNKLLFITSPKVINEIRDVVAAVDKPALQIMLEARIIEVAVEDEEKLGINWNKLTPFETIMYEGPTAPTAFRPAEIPQQVPYVPIEDLNDFGKIGYQEPIFQIAVDYLLKNNLAEVLANSQVATMNNKPASIEVIDRVPFVLSAGGVGGQVRTQTEEVGIKLHITPNVNTDGYITAEIQPEVSNVFQLIGPDQNIPWTVKRSANTTIRVKNGESIIIAGLISVNRKNTIYKVPFLGDLPFIGGIFRHKSITAKKTDLIIEVTPHIIADDASGIEKSTLIKAAEEHAVEPSGFEKMIAEEQEKKEAEAAKEEE